MNFYPQLLTFPLNLPHVFERKTSNMYVNIYLRMNTYYRLSLHFSAKVKQWNSGVSNNSVNIVGTGVLATGTQTFSVRRLFRHPLKTRERKKSLEQHPVLSLMNLFCHIQM